jgi:hypothetical protein
MCLTKFISGAAQRAATEVSAFYWRLLAPEIVSPGQKELWGLIWQDLHRNQARLMFSLPAVAEGMQVNLYSASPRSLRLRT